jgi:predicted O-linked N-acetylglucosamine transferase (SPINDLY family)
MYNEVDVGLDTYPYAGTTTTCEAMWMGVPVVTLAGRTHAGRVGISLLERAGLPELIAHDAAEYSRLALALARDTSRLEELRRTLRERLRDSSIVGGKGFMRSLEGAYLEMWERIASAPAD